VKALLKLLSGAYFIFASVYCFSACNSYTYLFLVKTPPYPWLSWVVDHGPLLYWLAFAAMSAAFWDERRNRVIVGGLLAQAAIGAVFTAKNLLANLENNWSAYVWSVAILLPMLLATAGRLNQPTSDEAPSSQSTMFSYSTAIMIATLAAGLSLGGLLIRNYGETRTIALHAKEFDLMVLVVAAHLWLAVLVVTLLNLVQTAAQRAGGRPLRMRRWAVLLLVFFTLDASTVRFLRNALSLEGWPIQIYAMLLAAFITGWGFSILSPLLTASPAAGRWPARLRQKFLLPAIFSGLLITALFAPACIGRDWNGLLEHSFNLFFWMILSVVMYVLWPRGKNYSVSAMCAILLVGGSLYWGLNASAFVWAKPLGGTPEKVTGSLQAYETQNASFGLVEDIYNSKVDGSCDQRCRILRQYTNIRHAPAKAPLRLVERVQPAQGARPNIFIIVIDSLRPDYLGAYNPAVDFTPNLDALARDSVVMRKAFTQYAGTSLSEPAIWSGALLLHSRYMRPFDNVNSLRTLARTDGYDLVVTYDHILRKLLSPEDDLIKLDANKGFQEMEISSTLEQLEAFLQDPHRQQDRPVLFYTQPMNIHELGVNNLPERTAANWRNRPGFSNRIAFKLRQVDEFLGGFFQYLKSRGLYDNSIIIVTADHGEATAELPGFGLVRRNHSAILFPEVMRVPLIVHLPRAMRSQLVWDENRLAALTDITPSLYYLLGHRPIELNPIFGRPLFTASAEELHRYDRDHLLLASDSRAAYGILSRDGRFIYAAYDSPKLSLLFDLANDPSGVHNIVSDELRARYDQQIFDDLRFLAAFYDFAPDGGSSAEFSWDR